MGATSFVVPNALILLQDLVNYTPGAILQVECVVIAQILNKRTFNSSSVVEHRQIHFQCEVITMFYQDPLTSYCGCAEAAMACKGSRVFDNTILTSLILHLARDRI